MFSPDVETIDLSIGLEDGVESEPWPPSIEYVSHAQGASEVAGRLRELGAEGFEAGDFPDGMALGWETVEAMVHTGTHVDAPWHYGPEVHGTPSRTIDELPLEWFFGEAVVLDFSWKEPGGEISQPEIEAQLEDLDHSLREGEIVLIETGADEFWGTAEYLTEFPGMGSAATRYLIEAGIRVIGIDAYGFDKPFVEMARRYAETGDSGELWPAHFVGREREYCQIEKMANLDELPRRTGIPLVTFPIKVEAGSAGWARPVAFV